LPSARALQEALVRYLEGDRELEQRRELAGAHAARARAALRRADLPGADREQESGIAIRELARALALEPTNQEHVAMFAEVMAAPPPATPREVSAQIEAQHQDVIRGGAGYAGFAVLSWFLFLPPILMLGLRRLDYLLVILVAVVCAAALSLAAARQYPIRRPLQCATLVAVMFASAAASRILGPLILAPSIITAWTIVMQINPDRFIRRFTVALGVISLVLPLGLELAGVIPSSYAFEDGKLIALPQMTELPRLPTFAFATLAHVGIALLPTVFVSRLRSQLTRAQERELVSAWQLRRLPEELMRASPR
jgi:serine/threonine-protein kinase